MKKISGLEPVLFYVFLALLLVPVWSVDFFVTGDGPCHFHNSKILLDWWHNTNRSFYDPFYYLNTSFNPNLLYYLITAPLLGFLSPTLVEKIFFSLYVLGFGLGFRFLISQINFKAKFISSLGLLFCYHNLLMKGFINNSLSFVVWFWVVGWWWKKRDDFSTGILISHSLLLLLLYSAHPIGLIFGIMMIGSMMLGLLVYESRHKGVKEGRLLFFRRLRNLFITALPTLVLFAEYMLRSDMSGDTTVHHVKDSFDYIIHLYSLVTLQSSENVLALFTSITCISVFLAAVILRVKQKGLVPADGLVLFNMLVMLCIIFPPNSISGGLEISFRMAVIPFVALLFWASTANFPLWSQLTAQCIAIGIGIGFMAIRLPVHIKASEYAKEIYSCKPYINDPATLFVLNYDWEGKTPDGKSIANRAWLFNHVDCYLGTDKSLIISDNYEAHFPYFPMIVRWNTNMYTQTDKDGINFDNRPPRADILNFNRRTGENIDYVLMISYREEFKDNPYTQEIFAQLDQAYTKIYTSQFERAVLYKRKE